MQVATIIIGGALLGGVVGYTLGWPGVLAFNLGMIWVAIVINL